MIAGRYSPVREIGRGGMGSVWLGQDKVLGRQVALKQIGLLPGAEDVNVVRVRREARHAASLSHPNVVAVFDLVEEGGRYWLVMEYVEGVTLGRLVRDQGRLAVDEAASVAIQAASGLAAAHAEGIVHRDVKPGNIMVTPDGEVRLTDFGIARADTDATITKTGLLTGSPAYLAPEIASGHPASPASDVWALGATVFHTLAGRPPYDVQENNVLGALYRIVHEEPPRTPTAGWLQPLLEGTMTKDPARRWPMRRVVSFLAAGQTARVSLSRGTASGPPGPAIEPDVQLTVTEPAAEGTQVLGPVSQPPPQQPPPGPQALRQAPRQNPPQTPRQTRQALIFAAAVLAGILMVLAGWLIFRDQTPDNASADDNSSDTNVNTAQVAGNPTAATMTEFINGYLADATDDPSDSWLLLTREFRDASNGFDSYEAFWNEQETAQARDVQADPESLTIRYAVDYRRTNGTTWSDEVQLELIYKDGAYRIASER
ncbi:serine/threonine-protein kinase [Nocardioides speluncae]|uniref:serine/threonine-protein kinase n=1 Tax=Nocardioides speluncae TaxID=2670337 RepID=UPI000D68FC16|nr:serine/threonine-protein kinase [Nocardioides speluncae]